MTTFNIWLELDHIQQHFTRVDKNIKYVMNYVVNKSCVMKLEILLLFFSSSMKFNKVWIRKCKFWILFHIFPKRLVQYKYMILLFLTDAISVTLLYKPNMLTIEKGTRLYNAQRFTFKVIRIQYDDKHIILLFLYTNSW